MARTLGGVLILLWLAVQVLVPLGPWIIPPWEARTDFSWDMFSYRRRCPGRTMCPGFVATMADGRKRRAGWGKGFNSKVHIARIRYRGRLREYGAWLCREGLPAAGYGEVARLEGRCECWYGRPGPDNEPQWVIEEGVNYCATTP